MSDTPSRVDEIRAWRDRGCSDLVLSIAWRDVDAILGEVDEVRRRAVQAEAVAGRLRDELQTARGLLRPVTEERDHWRQVAAERQEALEWWASTVPVPDPAPAEIIDVEVVEVVEVEVEVDENAAIGIAQGAARDATWAPDLYEAVDEPVCGDPFHRHTGPCFLRAVNRGGGAPT